MSKASKPALRIEKLANLKPIKLSVSFDSETYRMLEDYADIYEENYGESIKVSSLIPLMVISFLSIDVGFKKSRKSRNNG